VTLPTANAGGFSWWCRSPVLHERHAGCPPDYPDVSGILAV
jgi:hypothetical protein